MITLAQLQKIMPFAGPRAAAFFLPLCAAMTEYGIDTPAREAAFLAQVAHESGSLRYVREIASGRAYEGRKDLGNTQPGDGPRFKGRGLIQITGRGNYGACSWALFGDDRLIQQPALLEVALPACRSAGWFWRSRGLNELAAAGEFMRITRRINGGLNGQTERLAIYETARRVLVA